MRVGTDDPGVDERRPLARADVVRRLAHGAEAREEIGAVDRIDVKPRERSHEARDVAAGRLHFDRHRDRVAVVFDEKQHRQPAACRRC